MVTDRTETADLAKSAWSPFLQQSPDHGRRRVGSGPESNSSPPGDRGHDLGRPRVPTPTLEPRPLDRVGGLVDLSRPPTRDEVICGTSGRTHCAPNRTAGAQHKDSPTQRRQRRPLTFSPDRSDRRLSRVSAGDEGNCHATDGPGWGDMRPNAESAPRLSLNPTELICDLEAPKRLPQSLIIEMQSIRTRARPRPVPGRFQATA